jgi:membrane protein DedA with SNARE-associated domain
MLELKTAISVVEIIVVIIVAMALGDYLGYKIGRWRLVAILGGVTLATIIGFAIFSAVRLA